MNDVNKPPGAVIWDVDGTMYPLGPMRRGMALRLGLALLAHPIRTWRTVKVIKTYRRMQERLRFAGATRPETSPAPASAAPPAAGAPSAPGRPGNTRRKPDPQLAATADALGLPPETVAPVIEEWMRRRPLALLARLASRKVIELIRALHERDIPQAVYSDYPPDDKLCTLGVAACFDVVVWSGQPEIGEYKPSPKGFLHAAERLGVEPKRCLYIGDRPEVDGAGAEAAGMAFVDARDIRHGSILPPQIAFDGSA